MQVDQPVRVPAPLSAAETAAAAAAAASTAAEQLLAEEAQAASKAASKKAKKLKQKAKKQQKRHATTDTSEPVSVHQSGETAERSSSDDLTLHSLPDSAAQVPYDDLCAVPREASSTKARLSGLQQQMQEAALAEQQASCSTSGINEPVNGEQADAAVNDTASTANSLSLGSLVCCPITQVCCIMSYSFCSGNALICAECIKPMFRCLLCSTISSSFGKSGIAPVA